MNPKYPVYVISKGRWKNPITSRVLEKLGVPHNIVVEPQEYEQYASTVDPKKILIFPYSDLGQGSIPVRNWVWEHSIERGAKRHWILDDNIYHFRRMDGGVRIRVGDGTIFRVAEDLVDRYANVALAGPQYNSFAADITKPLLLNTRVYSCILIKNDIPYRWRGRYNEDTDLSLRVLKDGWCTMVFYFFLQEKAATMRMKGGNTDELYRQDGEFDGRLEMARSLVKQHPDVVKIARRWGRWQHQVDYSAFRGNKFRLRKGVKIKKGVDNYGMAVKNIGSKKLRP